MKRNLIFVFSLLILTACNSSDKKDKESVVISVYEEVKPQTELEKSIARGAEIYKNLCIQCHLPNGKGIKGLYPPLDGSNWLTEKRSESINAVKYGLRGEIVVNGKTYDNIMLPLGLNNREVADVFNYVMSSWGNILEREVTEEEVKNVTQ